MKTDEYVIDEPFNRLNDAYFKYVLASPEHRNLTVSFINAVLSYQPSENEKPVVIEDVEFLDRETVPLSEHDKIPRFDMLARSLDGRHFHVEVQNASEKSFVKRSLYYAAYDYTMQARKGADYSELRPVIFIGIMNFNLFGDVSEGRDWYTLHKLLNVKTLENKFHDVEFHMIELPVLIKSLKKLKDAPVSMSELERQLCYFSFKEGDKTMRKLLDYAAQKSREVAEMIDLEQQFRLDPNLRRQYMWAQSAHQDYLNNMKDAREKGLEEGLEEGRKDSARKLRLQGILSDEQIADALDIPVEVVKTL